MSEAVSENPSTVLKNNINNIANESQNTVYEANTLIEASAEIFQGPLPHPKLMAEYENILPGAADRIMTMAEKEQQNRHNFYCNCQKSDSRDSLLGICSAFIISALLIVCGVIVILKSPEHQLIGSFLAGVPTLGIMAAFLKHTKVSWKAENNSESEAKDSTNENQP